MKKGQRKDRLQKDSRLEMIGTLISMFNIEIELGMER